jgi:hypothetical protein
MDGDEGLAAGRVTTSKCPEMKKAGLPPLIAFESDYSAARRNAPERRGGQQ